MSVLNHISLRNKILLLVVLVFFCFVSVSFVAYQALISTNEREQAVKDAYSIIMHTRQLETSLHMMESGERGFLITGDPVFLEKYESGKQLYLATFGELQRQIPIDSSAYALLEEVDRELKKWKSQVAEPLIDLRYAVNRNEASLEQVIQGVVSRAGPNSFARISQIVGQVDALIKAHPLFAPAYYLQAQIAEHHGQLEAASAAYHRSVYLNPHLIVGYIGIAHVYIQLHQPEAARHTLRSAYNLLRSIADFQIVDTTTGSTTAELRTYVMLLIEKCDSR